MAVSSSCWDIFSTACANSFLVCAHYAIITPHVLNFLITRTLDLFTFTPSIFFSTCWTWLKITFIRSFKLVSCIHKWLSHTVHARFGLSHLSLQDLCVPLEDQVQRLEGVLLVFLAPKSTLVANARLTSLTINTHFLVMGTAFLLLIGSNHNLFLDSMKVVQYLHVWGSPEAREVYVMSCMIT